jgi:hypothetical protein
MVAATNLKRRIINWECQYISFRNTHCGVTNDKLRTIEFGDVGYKLRSFRRAYSGLTISEVIFD